MIASQHQVAIVTGASQGMGEAIALKLARSGIEILLLARNLKNLLKVQELIRKGGGQASAYPLDLSNPQEIKSAVGKIYKKYKKVDILINCAGINLRKNVFKIGLEDWNKEIQVNLSSVFLLTQMISLHMTKQKNGNIINIASFKAVQPSTSPSYGASKAGLVSLTKTFAQQLGKYNIRVNAISPGAINTKMLDLWTQDQKKVFLSKLALHRFGEPEEIANVVNFLISEQASYITGSILEVDGGLLD